VENIILHFVVLLAKEEILGTPTEKESLLNYHSK